MEMSWEKKSSIDLNNHKAVFAIGDIHGDMYALLQVLQLTGCVQVHPLQMEKSGKCWSNYSHLSPAQIKAEAELTNIQNTIQWIGDSSVVIFLGDILDNKRSESQPETGMCGWAGTQFQILDIIYHLKQEARAAGGDLRWILGNHDVWNASSLPPTCHRYSPEKQMLAGGKEYRACNANGTYSLEHRKNVLAYIKKLEAVALLRITSHSAQGRTHVLAMHGGLTNIPKLVQDMSKKAGITLKHEEGLKNIIKINQLYDRALTIQDEMLLTLIESSHMPTWCRPHTIENVQDMKMYFNTSRMVKGHDIQHHGANCNVKNKHSYISNGKNKSENEEFEAGMLCKMDTSMSRAFSGKRKQFTCIRLTTDKVGRMYRQLMRVIKEMDELREYKSVTNKSNYPKYSLSLQ